MGRQRNSLLQSVMHVAARIVTQTWCVCSCMSLAVITFCTQWLAILVVENLLADKSHITFYPKTDIRLLKRPHIRIHLLLYICQAVIWCQWVLWLRASPPKKLILMETRSSGWKCDWCMWRKANPTSSRKCLYVGGGEVCGVNGALNTYRCTHNTLENWKVVDIKKRKAGRPVDLGALTLNGLYSGPHSINKKRVRT